ncbi:hypothetical protein Agsp01_19440 [Agromyces sp. NBRC 114283]|nr:hypothetical protein Agsp01_19440 [Agromyces sp. NBRC 114283]
MAHRFATVIIRSVQCSQPVRSGTASRYHDLTTLIGERDEITDSTTVGDHGSRSAQRSIRRVPIMPPDVIRTLPFDTDLILLRAAPPIVTRLRPWTSRPDAKTLRDQRTEIETVLQQPPPEATGAPK